MPPAGNWLRFSGSLPPWLVLSHNMPMINTAGKLASFWRFSLTASSLSSHSLATDYWPLATVLMPLATVLSLHADPPRPAGSGRAQTLPRWLLPSTDRRIGKDRTGPGLDERPIHIQYVTEIQHVTEPGNFLEQINPFLPARRRPSVDHSLVAGGAQRQGLHTCRPDGHLNS